MPATLSINFTNKAEVEGSNPPTNKTVNAKVLADVLGGGGVAGGYVKLAGTETITGAKTFSRSISGTSANFSSIITSGTGANGSARLTNGSATNPGYLAWYTPDNVRRGYVGWKIGADNIHFKLENGWGLNIDSPSKPVVIDGDLEVTGGTIIDGDLEVTGGTIGIIPVGAVVSFAGKTAPVGWLICNGEFITTTEEIQGVPASSLTTLRNFLISNGRPFGSEGGNPRIPNLQGIFVRGSGSQSITNPAGAGGGTNTYIATHGTIQGDQFRRHTHAINTSNSPPSNSVYADPVRSSMTGGISNPRGGGLQGPSLTLDDTDLVVPDLTIKYTGGPSTNVDSDLPGETRPANLALLYCIRY